MSSTRITEATATFEQQAKDAGLHDDWIAAFKAANMDTLAKLCYAVTVPGTTPSDNQVAALLNLRPGIVPTLADSAAIKRLIFESQTFMIYTLKATIQGSEETTHKLAPAERRIRLEHQRARLAGVSISGDDQDSSRFHKLNC